jgi:hemerythrin-like domain-containing protein
MPMAPQECIDVPRVLLIYEAAIRKLSRNEDFDPNVVTQSAGIIRDFINNYHEKSEEEYVFPRFKSAGRMVDLVNTLLQQHEAGRRVSAAQLAALIEGLDWTRVHVPRVLRPQATQ